MANIFGGFLFAYALSRGERLYAARKALAVVFAHLHRAFIAPALPAVPAGSGASIPFGVASGETKALFADGFGLCW